MNRMDLNLDLEIINKSYISCVYAYVYVDVYDKGVWNQEELKIDPRGVYDLFINICIQSMERYFRWNFRPKTQERHWKGIESHCIYNHFPYDNEKCYFDISKRIRKVRRGWNRVLSRFPCKLPHHFKYNILLWKFDIKRKLAEV